MTSVFSFIKFLRMRMKSLYYCMHKVCTCSGHAHAAAMLFEWILYAYTRLVVVI